MSSAVEGGPSPRPLSPSLQPISAPPSPEQTSSPTTQPPVSLSPIPVGPLEPATTATTMLVSTASQTTIQMIDVMCQTVDYLKQSLTKLDVAVQTIDMSTEADDDSNKQPITAEVSLSPSVDPVRANEEMDVDEDKEDVDEVDVDEDNQGDEEDGDKGDQNAKVDQLLQYAKQNKSNDDEYPCKVCRKIFVSMFALKTHISVAHQKYIQSDSNSVKHSSSVGGVKKTGMKAKSGKKTKKLTLTKRKWCNYCWIRFNSKSQYEAHRREVHPDMIGSRNTSISSPSPALDSSRAFTPVDTKLTAASPGESGVSTRSNTPANVANMDTEDAEVEDDSAIMYLDSEEREQLTSECLDKNRKADIKLIKVDQVLDLDDDNSLVIAGPEEEQETHEPVLEADEVDGGVAEFYTSLPWYEARFHLCLMCEKLSPLGNFSSHVVDVHGISMLLYRERFPSDDFSAKTWQCTICDRGIKWTQPSISRHLRSAHSLSMQEYRGQILEDAPADLTKQVRADTSLPWYECRKHRCRICNNILLFSDLSQHLSEEHSCDADAYRLMFPNMVPSQLATWRCMVCNNKTTWNKANIQHHLLQHELSLEEYENKYVEDIKLEHIQPPERPQPQGTLTKPQSTSKSSSKSEVKKEENGIAKLEEAISENETGMETEEDEDTGTSVTSRIVKLEARDARDDAANLKSNVVKVSQHDKVWVPWYESKLHTCNLCGEMRTCGLSLKNHIYDKHQFLSRRDYVKKFPMADIEPAQWGCNLCTNTVKWTKKCIADHLKSAHSMTKEEYETMFNIPPRHQVQAPAGGEYNFNSRTDIGIANKDGVVTAEPPPNVVLPPAPASVKAANKCGLCSEPVETSLTVHINNYHKMTKAAYLKICPSDQFKLVKKTWKCKICDLSFADNKTVMKEHLEEQHAIDIADYTKTFSTTDESQENGEDGSVEMEEDTSSVISAPVVTSTPVISTSGEDKTKYKMLMRGNESPWYETVKITCRECDNEFWLGQFMKHIILNHKMPIKVYRSKHPETQIPKKSYTCRICGIPISHYASPISGHLTGRHNITMNEYYEKYEKNKVEPPKEPIAESAEKTAQKSAATAAILAAKAAISPQITIRKVTPSSGGGGLVQTPLGNSHMDSPNVKNQRQAEFAKSGKIPWYECKTTLCKFCGEEWLLGSFRRHLYDRHDKMSRTGYMEMFPDADISLPTWHCKICGNGVRWVRDNIFYHLRTHNFTMEGYRQLYIEGENSQEQPPSSPSIPGAAKQLPSLVPIAGGNGTKEKKFRCKLCNVLVAFESNAIKLHLKSFHNLTINEYQPLARAGRVAALAKPGGSGGDEALRKEDAPAGGQHFMSSILEQRLRGGIPNPPTLTMLTPRVANPNSAAADPPNLATRVATSDKPVAKPASQLPWYNKCKWTCMVCRRAFSSGFWKHIQEEHNKNKEEYLKEHGKAGIEIVHYYCKMCNKKIPWSGASINSHTKTEHNMTLKEYETKYEIKTEVEVKQEPTDSSAPTNTTTVKDEPESPNVSLSMPEMQDQVSESNYIHSLQDQVTESNYIHSPNHWFNGCEYKCQVCESILHSVAGLSMHLKDVHSMDKFSYFRQYGRTGINIRKYRCKICLKDFPWSGVSISKHLKQAHFMTLEKYSSVYEVNSTVESLSRLQEGEGDTPSPITIKKEVDRLSTENEGAIVVDPMIVTPTIITTQPPPVVIKDRGPKWYNKCSWTCQICGETTTTNSSAFYKHVVQDHGVAIDDYKEEYGNTGFVYVDHTCKLCNQKVPFNGLSMCKHFKHSHSMQLEEYEARYMKDDDGTSTGEYYAPTDEYWYNKCNWKCLICGNKNKSLGSSKKHITKVHNISYEDYITEYGTSGITEVSFSCNLCAATMSCNGVTIASHLMNLHKLTLNEYERDHLNSEPVEPPQPVVKEPQVDNLPEDGLTGDQPSNQSAMLTRRDRPWYQKCQYFCQICNQSYFSISALRNHTKIKHNMDRDTYVSIYGLDAGKVIEDYNCKICSRRVKCEGRSLNAHMRNCHKMGILDYSKKYETERHYNGDPQFYNETYHIEMDTDVDEDNVTMEYQDEEDMDTDTSLMDPLTNFVTTELHDEEEDENQEEGEHGGDMTVEESIHFNFEDEDEGEIEVKPDISHLNFDHENTDEMLVEEEEEEEESESQIPAIQITADEESDLVEQQDPC